MPNSKFTNKDIITEFKILLSSEIKVISKELSKLSREIGGLSNRVDFLHTQYFDLSERLELVEERTRLIPNIWNYLDGFASKVSNYDQEIPLINNQLDNHEDRLSKLEIK